MNLTSISLFTSLVATVILGLLVFAANRKRLINRQFLILSLHLGAWIHCVLQIINASDSNTAEFWVRAAFFIAAFFPASFLLVQCIISNDKRSWGAVYREQAPFLLINLAAATLPLFPFFLHGVILSSPNEINEPSVPEAKYGIGFYIFCIYFLLACAAAGAAFFKALRNSKGIQRHELQFILLGFSVCFATGTSFSIIIPAITGSNQSSQFGPLGVIIMNLIVAYGITTRRILGIATILQKVTAYALLVLYLCIVYYLAFYGVVITFSLLNILEPFLINLIVSIIVSLSIFPAYNRFQIIAHKLILSTGKTIQLAMKQAGNIFQSVSIIGALQTQFTGLLASSLKASRVILLTKSQSNFHQTYPPPSIDQTQLSLLCDSAIATMIMQSKEPVSLTTLERSRENADIIAAKKEFHQTDTSLAVGIFSKNELEGIMLFGERESAHIYDKAEQDALQILCNQFAIALENATLYTEAQDSKIRNDILLNQLVNGVIVVDTERRISLFNREAERITRLSARVAIGNDMSILPEPIIHILEATLKKQARKLYLDAVLFPEEEQRVVLQMGTSFLFGHDQKPMGALLVLNDQTELKSLEAQVRRNDQLSTVGTLAAGMAHEIKNPLVTIKTFTQLLPQRYEDADFREEFSELVASEVKRIDGIVTQLLGFSKPIIPSLKPIHLHQTVLSSIHLIHQKAAKHGITIKTELHAENDFIQGDEDLITQSLVNLYLNAIDAINSAENDGLIIVKSTNCRYKIFNVKNPEHTTEQSCIRLQVVDNGCGIAPEKLKKIFDPFFTSKSEGTGMGLSVVHGILQEHQAVIEVDSRPGKGTTFTVHFPLCVQEARS